MELIKVTGPAKNRDTLVSLKWNNGNVGHIAIKKDKKLVLLGKTEHGYFVSKNHCRSSCSCRDTPSHLR